LDTLGLIRKVLGPSLGVGTITPSSPFFAMTVDEFNQTLTEIRKELDCQVVLMLTASFEAVFQTDLRKRIDRKEKGVVSKALRSWWQGDRRRRKRWIDLASLLDVWKKTVGHGQVIGRMKSLLLHRHWLAHGRYWNDKSGLRDVDPPRAWEIARAVFAVLPGFRPLPAL
jgi:hypothetical protein